MEKNLPYQTIRPLAPPIRLLRQLMAQLRARAVLFGKFGIIALTFKSLALQLILHKTSYTALLFQQKIWSLDWTSF